MTREIWLCNVVIEYRARGNSPVSIVTVKGVVLPKIEGVESDPYYIRRVARHAKRKNVSIKSIIYVKCVGQSNVYYD